jgi:hypothetical protein
MREAIVKIVIASFVIVLVLMRMTLALREKQLYSLRKQVSDIEGAMHPYLGTQIKARA